MFRFAFNNNGLISNMYCLGFPIFILCIWFYFYLFLLSVLNHIQHRCRLLLSNMVFLISPISFPHFLHSPTFLSQHLFPTWFFHISTPLIYFCVHFIGFMWFLYHLWNLSAPLMYSFLSAKLLLFRNHSDCLVYLSLMKSFHPTHTV